MAAFQQRYVVADMLGRGGMGAVYRARDVTRDREVALKRLRIEEGARHAEERTALFHREYRTLAELDHPRVIEVYDYGIDDDGPYYTMELLDGEDLRAKAPLPYRAACSLIRDVCSSLALLHSRGMVHRDVSPLNVRCTSDGRAKLIDFGAMAPMGVSRVTMGTPPCVAPEAVGRQQLDGRTDLFSLGATLYFTLTGYQAFPARSLSQLRLLHRRPPPPPSTFASDVPESLDALVLSMLSTDAMARPRHAAEVMERLTSIASLEPLEQVEVSRAYLNTPAIVGREAVTKRLLSYLQTVLAGNGRAVRLYGHPGGGRSRILHATVMEARLSGMTVLRAGAREVAEGPFAVLRALLRELRTSTDQGGAQLERHRDTLGPLLDGGALSDDSGTRQTILKALADLVPEIAQQQALLVAVDDVDQCDEASLAALLTLLDTARRLRIGLCLTDSRRPIQAHEERALSLLREVCEPVRLSSLNETLTEELLASVFGRVPHLAAVSHYIYQRAVGNPRATMELAQHLVERGIARYELGSWTLPAKLDAGALPGSLLELRREKLEGLDDDARELAGVLAVVDGHPLELEDLVSLTEHGDTDRLVAAHDGLLQARIVEPTDAQALSDRGWYDIFSQDLAKERVRRIERRLADILAGKGASVVDIACCLMQAGDPAAAIDLLCARLEQGTLIDGAGDQYPDLLLQALEECERLQRHPLDRFLIQREITGFSDRLCLKGIPECFAGVFDILGRASGLADYHELAGRCAEEKRLELALTAAQARYDAAEGERRGPAPLDALQGLVESVYAAGVYSAVVGDMEMLESIPSLAPLEALSPAIAIVSEAVGAQRALIGARYEDALALYAERLSGLDTEQHLTEAQITRSRTLLHYAIGLLQGGLGIKGALEQARALESLPQGQVLAAAVQENYCVRRGNARAAQKWRRRLELLQIQQKRPHALNLRQATVQLECSAHGEDLEETKRNIETLEELCEIFPSAVPYVAFGRAEYARIRGDFSRALSTVRETLAMTSAGRHPVWPWAAGCEVECLRQLGELDEALAVGLQRVGQAQAAGLQALSDHIEVFVALTEGQLGRLESAVERVERGLRNREQLGMRGLNLGWSFEARARLALWMNDRKVFERCARECSRCYGGGRDNPALAARHARLMQEAEATWGELARSGGSSGATGQSGTDHSGVESGLGLGQGSESAGLGLVHTLSHSQAPLRRKIARCADPAEGARVVLEALMEAAGSRQGQLYLLYEGGLTLAAAEGSDSDLGELIEHILGLGEGPDEAQTQTEAEDELASNRVAAESGELTPVLLGCPCGRSIATIGAVALDNARGATTGEFFELSRLLSSALLERGEIKPRLT